MRRLGALGATLALLVLLPTVLPLRMAAPPPRSALPLSFKVLKGTIGRDTTLAAVLSAALSPAKIHRLVEAAQPVYDLARVSVGHPFGLALGADGLIAAFTYGIDELRTLRVVRRGAQLEAELLQNRYDVRVERTGAVIETSLFDAVTASGERDQLALDIADIFAWDVDFNTEIQRGDSFRVAVEKLYLHEAFARYGRILAAEFVRGGRTLRALSFAAGRGPGYYAPDGTPLRKAFLRSPLRFTRISSRFSRARLHPILNSVRPHLGVDYAAPAGTPVTAAADGWVSLAGWLGGYGRAVRIRHANGFETLYGHLSRVDVRPGQRVTQGSTIGAVGSSGLATAPHLDYRMTRNGAFVNPLTVQLPPAEPLSPLERPAFGVEAARLIRLLGSDPSVRRARALPGPRDAASPVRP